MQIKFLTLYHLFKDELFKDEEYSKALAQSDLLSMWRRSVEQRQVKFTEKAAVQFQVYSFFSYPNQEKLIKEIKSTYGHKNKQTNLIEYWWGGEQYEDLEDLYKALAEEKRLMELTITVE